MNLIDTLLGISSAVAEEAATPTASAGAFELLGAFLPMILIFVVFYFMLIRPQRKKDKAVKKMLESLKVSDRICTIGGIYGTITAIKDDTVTLSVGNKNMTMVVARWAIRNVEDIVVENDGDALN